MFDKILNILDFAKGYKTLVSAVALIASTMFVAQGYDIQQDQLIDLYNSLIDNSIVIVSAAGVIYGAVMKIVRVFR